MLIHLKEKTWNWHARTITLLELWSSDLMCRLEIQSWCSDLKFRLGNLQSRIEDWRFSRALLGESSIQDWRLKVEDSPGLLSGNLQSRIEDWRFSRTLAGESSIQDWRLKIENSPGLFLENLLSKTENSILKVLSWIEDSPRRVLENLQSSILDWRFSKKSLGESSIFNPGLQPIPERDQEMPEDEEMPQAEVTEESQAAEWK